MARTGTVGAQAGPDESDAAPASRHHIADLVYEITEITENAELDRSPAKADHRRLCSWR